MEKRLLGYSGLQVSVLSLGTLTFGGVGERAVRVGGIEPDEARRMIDVCMDAGVNLFDTANVYQQGRAEEVLGEALAGKRHDVLVASKVFSPMGDGDNDKGLSRHHIIRSCEASLRRLDTDYIDLYQAHNFDALTPLEETLAAFDHLIQAGKVRYIGCSNYSGWQLMKALGLAKEYHTARYVSQQVYYSLIGRELEFELLPLSLDQNVGVLVWGPLAQGFLGGKYRRDSGFDKQGRYAYRFEPPINIPDDQAYDIVDALYEIAQTRGVSVAQVAVNWVIGKRGVTSVIFGARNMEQLQDNLNAATWRLTADEIARLDAVSAPPIPYPYWHQRKYGVGRNPLLF